MNAMLNLLAGVLGVVTQPLHTRTDEILLEFAPRTPNQMSSFYEARGFPKPMINELKQQCFITVRIHNTSQKQIWVELENWEFSSNGKSIEREPRSTWKQRWQDMDIPLRFQSTFGWTLLPEARDTVPGEIIGGNIILPRNSLTGSSQLFTIKASFNTGPDKQSTVINIEYDKLQCANNAPTENDK